MTSDNKETFESYIEKWKKRNKSNTRIYDYIKQLHNAEIKNLADVAAFNFITFKKEKDKQISNLKKDIQETLIDKDFKIAELNEFIKEELYEYFKMFLIKAIVIDFMLMFGSIIVYILISSLDSIV